MSEAFDCDVVVVGAGAAGLVAAARAARAGARVIALEKNRRAGVKILMSGGTRCNLTNARGLRRLDVVSGPVDPAFSPAACQGARAIVKAFEPNGAFLSKALRAFDVDATVGHFEALGVAVKVEANGKIFPVSDRATDVLSALVGDLTESGATLRPNAPALGVQPLDASHSRPAGFAVETPGGEVTARRVILTLGGASFPGCGTTGDGYEFARRLGHTIVLPRPALAPLKVATDWVSELKGLSVVDAVARVRSTEGVILEEQREAVLFTHFGLSGPAILDVSRGVRVGGPRPTLELDFLPELSRDAFEEQLQVRARQGRPLVSALIPPAIPRRLAERLLSLAGVPPGRLGPELAREERRRLVDMIKRLVLPIEGDLGFAKAEVTTGGVALDQVDPATLESRLAPGLYLAGEILDLDGPIGGHNFQAAWSTGWLAGQSAARRDS